MWLGRVGSELGDGPVGLCLRLDSSTAVLVYQSWIARAHWRRRAGEMSMEALRRVVRVRHGIEGSAWMRLGWVAAWILLGVVPGVWAHEMRPAYLGINEVSEWTYDVLWKVPEGGEAERLALQVRFAADVEAVGEPEVLVADGTRVLRWRVRREGGLSGTEVTIDGLAATYTDAMARVALLDMDAMTVLLKPDRPSFRVPDRPTGWDVASAYSRLGVEHILLGADHLLFVLGLLLLVDRTWMLIKTITAFTVAHSITLALSVFAIVRVPEAPLNACIALSILFLGPEIVRKWRGGTSLTIRHPWMVAFAFGLLHGIGFASGLSLTGIPRGEIPSALLFFNVGVEAGQLAFVLTALAAARAIRTLDLDRPRWVARIPAYAIGSLGAYWTIQRILMMLVYR